MLPLKVFPFPLDDHDVLYPLIERYRKFTRFPISGGIVPVNCHAPLSCKISKFTSSPISEGISVQLQYGIVIFVVD